MIAVDIEVFDPNLKTLGDGSIRKDGHVLCIGLFDGSDYVCCEPADPRLRDWLASDEDKVFHNGVYDLSWLICNLGLQVGGIWHDTMTRAALINEYDDLDLDSCCKRLKVKGKSGDIDTWWEENKKYLGLKGSFWANADTLWYFDEVRAAVIKYNEQDCRATYALFQVQEKYVPQDVYKLECDLYPFILEMKKNGIKVDIIERDRFTDKIEHDLKDIEQKLWNEYKINEEILASPKKLGLAMNALGVRSPVATKSGAQSWAADVLDLIEHPVTDAIQEARNYQALLNKYLRGPLIKQVINERIHCTFSPNKRDSGGTITGRYASSKPNMQQVPARDMKHGQKSYGQEMRAMFLPDDGCMIGAFDYGQIEARLLAHYGQGRQADSFRQRIINGDDYHKIVMEMTGITNRDIVKRMNFGFIYGMGIVKLMSLDRQLFTKLADEAKLSYTQYGNMLYETYHSKFPVIRDTMKWCMNVTEAQGYIDSLGGRRHHKPKPFFMNGKWNSGLYKMTNYLIQGSAAEILKTGQLTAWNAGIFNVLKMHLTVHDENVVSIPYNKIGVEAAFELEQCMLNALKDRLSVPMTVGIDVGENWGAWDSPIWKEMKEGKFNRRLAV